MNNWTDEGRPRLADSPPPIDRDEARSATASDFSTERLQTMVEGMNTFLADCDRNLEDLADRTRNRYRYLVSCGARTRELEHFEDLLGRIAVMRREHARTADEVRQVAITLTGALDGGPHEHREASAPREEADAESGPERG